MAAKYNLRIDQGATFRRSIIWANALLDLDGNLVLDAEGLPQQGDPIDLTGYIGRMKIRKAVNSPTPMLAIESVDGLLDADQTGISFGADPSQGVVTVVIADEDTASLDSSGVYDIELESSGGEVTRILQGKVRLSQEVTRDDA